MLKMTAKTIGSLAAVAALAGLAPGRAAADSVTGAVYLNQGGFFDLGPAYFPTSTAPAFTTPDATFTSSSLNYNDSGRNTVGGFLGTKDAATLSAPIGGQNLQETYFLFSASVYLSAGKHTLVINHDDGAELTSTGGAGGALTFSNISAGSQYSGHSIGYSAPTVANSSTGTQSGTVNVTTAGVYTFKLGYGEVNSLPAILSFTVDGAPVQTTPEPSTVVMAGTAALAGLGCAVRRRRKRA